MASTAIFYHPDLIESPKTPLAGRRAAGQSFLGGYVRHASGDTLRCVGATQPHLQQFADVVKSYGWKGKVEGRLAADVQGIGSFGSLMLPGPALGPYAWQRRRGGTGLYSLVGITHTVSTRRMMEAVFNVPVTPVEEWDAIICTSQAVHAVVAQQLEETETYLRRRFQARRVPMPQLPIIPLGIDTARFRRDDAARARWRKRFDLAEDEIAVLCMGRRSVFEKMHPVPLFLALQQAAEASGAKITLLMAGWFGDETAERLHRDPAKALAPDVRVVFPDGKDPDLRYEIWSAGDIFALPVDNIQETFGLVPVEAMAAGLPVICSDWNGFRDTVVHGETGFRVTTRMARPGHGSALATRFEDGLDNYHQYLGFVHQRTAVDVPEMADALTTLINDPEKRAAMGAAGQARARALYDWSAIIPQYEALWADLAARRARGRSTATIEESEPANPASIDPFRLYGGYPTGVLPPSGQLSARARVEPQELERYIELTGVKDIRRMVADADLLIRLQRRVADTGPCSVETLFQKAGLNAPTFEGCLLWLLKFDLLQLDE